MFTVQFLTYVFKLTHVNLSQAASIPPQWYHELSVFHTTDHAQWRAPNIPLDFIIYQGINNRERNSLFQRRDGSNAAKRTVLTHDWQNGSKSCIKSTNVSYKSEKNNSLKFIRVSYFPSKHSAQWLLAIGTHSGSRQQDCGTCCKQTSIVRPPNSRSKSQLQSFLITSRTSRPSMVTQLQPITRFWSEMNRRTAAKKDGRRTGYYTVYQKWSLVPTKSA